MEIKNIMVNEVEYGRQELPPISKVVKSEDKYWGDMKTLFENDQYTVKRIFMRKGTQSSMEYHIKKDESYYIESGQLKIGTRIGRAKNTSLILNEGDVIEFSTLDDDTDSHIVEDGKIYKHVEEC